MSWLQRCAQPVQSDRGFPADVGVHRIWMTRRFVIVIAPVGDVDDVVFVQVGPRFRVWTRAVGDDDGSGTAVDV